MLDRSIPFYNIILKCEDPPEADIILPEGFSLRPFRRGDEKAWAALEYETGDFPSPKEAETYFKDVYCQNIRETERRCIFAVNTRGEAIGTCTAWKDPRGGSSVASLHWLVVSPAYQGIGLGKALCQRALQVFRQNRELPVYIHTQPWSYKAILLYVRQGFLLQKTDTFAHYQNQYTPAMETLKNYLTPQQYEELAASSL